MGTWDAGPFGNDAALDHVGDVIETLMQPIREFMDSPEIDETFDPAFASVAILNEIMAITPCRPWDPDADEQVNPEPICAAMLSCFDEEIGDLDPDADFEVAQRASLVTTLDRFRGFFAD